MMDVFNRKIQIHITILIIMATVSGLVVLNDSKSELEIWKINLVNPETSKYQFHSAFAQTPDFQLIIIYPTTPIQDNRLAEYNKAVNFQNLKPILLESDNPKTILLDIKSELNQQITQIRSESSNIKQYNQDGSLTQEYSNWWMKNYVTSRFSQDCISSILDYTEQGMSLQTALSRIEPEMQQIIADYTKTDEQKQADAIQAKTQAKLKEAEAKLGIPIKTELDAFYPDSLQIDLGKLDYLQISNDAKEKASSGNIISKFPDDPQLDKLRLQQIHVIIQTLSKQRDYLELQLPKISLASDGTEKPLVTEINKKTAEIGRYINPLSKMQDLLYKGASYETAKAKVGFDVDAMSFAVLQLLAPKSTLDLTPKAKSGTSNIQEDTNLDKITSQDELTKLKAENKALKKEIQKLKIQIKKLLKSLEKTKISIG